jgi:hypothetical protein
MRLFPLPSVRCSAAPSKANLAYQGEFVGRVRRPPLRSTLVVGPGDEKFDWHCRDLVGRGWQIFFLPEHRFVIRPVSQTTGEFFAHYHTAAFKRVLVFFFRVFSYPKSKYGLLLVF